MKKTWVHHYLPLVFTLAITFVAFAPSLHYGFVWDDFTFIDIWDQPKHLSANFINFFLGDVAPGHGGVYRPLRSIFYGISYLLWQRNPYGYHLQALIIHLLSTAIIYLIASKLTRSTLVSAMSSLIFGLHPVHIETITFTTTSFDAVGILFALISIYFFLKHHSRINLILSLIFVGLAFFTYEITLLLPLILFTYQLLHHPQKMISSLRFFISVFSLEALYLLIRFVILDISSRDTFFYHSIGQLTSFVIHALVKYIWLAFLPLNLTVNHQLFFSMPSIFYFDHNPDQIISIPSFWHFPTNLYLLVLLIIGAITIKLARIHPSISWLICWFFLALIPVLQLIPQDLIFAEKYLYFATAASSILLAYTFNHMIHKRKFYRSLAITPPIILSLSTFYIGFLFFQTQLRNQIWESPQSLWSATVSQSPNSAIAHNNLGSVYFVQDDFSTAKSLYLRSLNLNSHHGLTHANLGLLFQKTSQFDLAIFHFQQAVELEPDEINYQMYLANVYLQTGNFEQALPIFIGLHAREPQNPNLINAIATIYHQQQNLDQASRFYLQVIELAPGEAADAHNNLGNIYQALGDLEKAKYHYSQALEINPNHYFAQQNLHSLLEP